MSMMSAKNDPCLAVVKSCTHGKNQILPFQMYNFPNCPIHPHRKKKRTKIIKETSAATRKSAEWIEKESTVAENEQNTWKDTRLHEEHQSRKWTRHTKHTCAWASFQHHHAQKEADPSAYSCQHRRDLAGTQKTRREANSWLQGSVLHHLVTALPARNSKHTNISKRQQEEGQEHTGSNADKMSCQGGKLEHKEVQDGGERRRQDGLG